MKRTLIISGIVVAVAVIALVIFNRVASAKKGVNLLAEAQKGTFEITVSASGELVPERSIDIRGPVFSETGGDNSGGNRGQSGGSRGMDMHFMDLKILDIVPEGTIVKQGDYVAQLDRTSYDNSFRDEIQNLANLESSLQLKILDTAMTMTTLRDQIKNQTYAVEEAKINLDQSKFEPPATIRKAEVTLERETRSLEQLKKSYALKSAQTLADIKTVKRNLDRKRQLVEDLQEYLSNFTIKAPADGMVTYKKDRGGSKRKTGSSINAFDMIVATLPDLTSMLSKIYVNEIEVSKVQVGQSVDISVDAFPGKQYKGKVISIGNVGETLPNSDAKMFETLIRLESADPLLRPSMTTDNKIIISSINDAVYIPTECIQTGSDSIPFVYMRNRTKHVVVLGASNEKFTIVEKGVQPGSSVYIVPPEDPESFRLIGEDLIPVIKERQKANRVN
jgi:multidrug efflux pump subunit AcrA (membrane-fusion protein)